MSEEQVKTLPDIIETRVMLMMGRELMLQARIEHSELEVLNGAIAMTETMLMENHTELDAFLDEKVSDSERKLTRASLPIIVKAKVDMMTEDDAVKIADAIGQDIEGLTRDDFRPAIALAQLQGNREASAEKPEKPMSWAERNQARSDQGVGGPFKR